MAKEIPTAQRETVQLGDGTKIVVQELSTRGVLSSLHDIQKIIAKAKALGSIDDLLASFRDAEGKNTQGVDKVLDALNMILSIVGDDEDLLPRMVSRCLVGNHTPETVGDMVLDDVLSLGQAVYQVNWVKGSLKKALRRFGLKFEEEKSPNLRSVPKQPSETPQDKPAASS